MRIRMLTAVAVACVVASLLAAGAEAQSAGVQACASKLVGYAAYMNGTDTDKPPETCCGPLRDAVKNELRCLCDLYATPEIFKAFNINITDALRLSKRCGISETTTSCPELAAEYGTREDVELLFPVTSPISTVGNWSIDGIISHVKMEIKQLEDANFVKTRKADLKRQADVAFKKQDYLNASVFYTQEYTSAYHALSRALELDPESEETEKLFWEAMELRE